MRDTLRILLPLLFAILSSTLSPAQLVTGLTAVDVGAPPSPGATRMNGPGAFAVTGSGEYKNSSSDNFHFAYTNVTGNFDYQVQIESLEVPNTWSKVGLMARETTDAGVTSDLGSRAVTMTAYPPAPKGGNTFILIRREQVDGTTSDDNATPKPVYPNVWLRLRRLGDWIVGYTGTNGTTWTLTAVRDSATWADGPLTPNLLLGLAVASAAGSTTCTAQSTNFGSVPSSSPVSIAVPLKSITVNKGKPAKFSLTVSGYDPYYAQWYTNGIAIPGATNVSFGGTLTYTTPTLTLNDDNTRVSVVVSNSVNTVTNSDVVLRVLDDNTPPAVSAATTDNGELDVIFSEEISPTPSLTLGNYTLNGAGVDALDVALSSNNRLAFLLLSGGITSTNATVTVRRMQDLVGNVGTSVGVPIWPLLAASNIVASGYTEDDRALAFMSVTDGIVDAGWQTHGDKDHRPQFAGLIYADVQTFGVIKVDLGEQNEFGGAFAEKPKLYLLKQNKDTDVTGPETDPLAWQEVDAPMVSTEYFDANVDPNPSPASPIVFDLSGLSATQRTGYGWAVGGVSGDNSGFIRISELRAYGQSGGVIESPRPSLGIATSAGSGIVISWPSTATGFVLKSSPSVTAANWDVVTDPKPVLVGTNWTVTLPSPNGTRFYRLEE